MGNMVWMKLARGNRPQNNKMCQCAQPARRAARTLSPGEPRRITGRGSGLQNSSPPRDVSTCPDSSPQEALVRAKPHPSLQIDYDILLSPTYQVPVLYFGLRWHNHGPLGLEEVYQYVVPERYRQELKSVGVMGGISMGVGAFSEPRDKSSCLFCFFFSCSTILDLALRHFSSTHATPRMPWRTLQTHRASLPGHISSFGLASLVIA